MCCQCLQAGADAGGGAPVGDRKAGGLWDCRGLPCHSFLSAFLLCTHTTHRFSFWGSTGTQPLPCPGSWCRTCSLPGQTDVSSPHSGQRLLAHFLSPPAPPRTQTFLSPGQTDCSLPQDGPLADLPFLCLASCFLLHYVQFVSAGLME